MIVSVVLNTRELVHVESTLDGVLDHVLLVLVVSSQVLKLLEVGYCSFLLSDWILAVVIRWEHELHIFVPLGIVSLSVLGALLEQ